MRRNKSISFEMFLSRGECWVWSAVDSWRHANTLAILLIYFMCPTHYPYWEFCGKTWPIVPFNYNSTLIRVVTHLSLLCYVYAFHSVLYGIRPFSSVYQTHLIVESVYLSCPSRPVAFSARGSRKQFLRWPFCVEQRRRNWRTYSTDCGTLSLSINEIVSRSQYIPWAWNPNKSPKAWNGVRFERMYLWEVMGIFIIPSCLLTMAADYIMFTHQLWLWSNKMNSVDEWSYGVLGWPLAVVASCSMLTIGSRNSGKQLMR